MILGSNNKESNMSTGKFEVLKDLEEAIKLVDRDKMLNCEIGWDDLRHELDSTRDGLLDCLNELEERLEKLAKSVDSFEANIMHAVALGEEVGQFTKWTRNTTLETSK